MSKAGWRWSWEHQIDFVQDILATAELLLIGTQACQTHIAIQIEIMQEPLIISLPKIQIHRDALLLEFRLKGS